MVDGGGEGKSHHVRNFSEMVRADKTSPVVSAIRALTEAIKVSEATTVMGLHTELKDVTKELAAEFPRHAVSLISGSELFMKFVTRVALTNKDFQTCKATLIERGEKFMDLALRARDTISEQAQRFVKDGSTVLVHGYSRAVLTTLRKAASQCKFECIVTEAQPDGAGYQVANELVSVLGVPCTVVRDSAVAYVMDRVDFVMSGAEGVMESGGIISKIGTYQVSLVAKACGKPFYVIAESFKFVRLFPLSQADVQDIYKKANEPFSDEELARFGDAANKVVAENPALDYTPPKNITLLCTDLGVFTPSRVSDELIRLHS